MSSLTFPTGKSGRNTTLGSPVRAEPCRCETPLPDSSQRDHCLRCGHDSRAVIDASWELRAAVVALPDAKRLRRELVAA